jgi:hypothetical protein
MTLPPSPKTTRVSVPVTPEVLEKFQRFSEVSGLSVGKSMGDWLRDTMAGLDAMTEILELHKRAPGEAIAKFQGLATSLQTVSEEAIVNMRRPRSEGPPLAGEGSAADLMRAAARETPRLVIRGGKPNESSKGKRS